MASIYAENYRLLIFAGSDDHIGGEQTKLAGMCFDSSLMNEADFVRRVTSRQDEIFTAELLNYNKR